MMRTSVLLCFVLLIPAGRHLKADDNPRERTTLRGLKAFNVVVDPPEAALQDRGLTPAAIETEVEQRLTRGGVTVDKNAYEFVAIRVMGAHAKRSDFALCVSLAVYQTITLKRDPTIVSATPTWRVESVLLAPPQQLKEAWTDTINELVDQFLVAWKDVNGDEKKD